MSASNELKAVKNAAKCCQNCDLFKYATQTVFGEGAVHARVMMIGEQPGDKEDLVGHPFIGPAGKLLMNSMEEAGLSKDECYVTNVVKHFKFEWRGERRIHSKPRKIEVIACLPWLMRELEIVKPQIIVCLGATAAQTLLGNKFRVTKSRGKLLETNLALKLIATVHPSSILRADPQDRDAELKSFVNDLKVVMRELKQLKRVS